MRVITHMAQLFKLGYKLGYNTLNCWSQTNAGFPLAQYNMDFSLRTLWSHLAPQRFKNKIINH